MTSTELHHSSLVSIQMRSVVIHSAEAVLADFKTSVRPSEVLTEGQATQATCLSSCLALLAEVVVGQDRSVVWEEEPGRGLRHAERT
jgi:hypothetical protein